MDFSQIIKTYGKAEGIDNERRYSPLPAPALRRSSYGDRRIWTPLTRHT